MHKNWFMMARAIALLVFLVSGAWGDCSSLCYTGNSWYSAPNTYKENGVCVNPSGYGNGVVRPFGSDYICYTSDVSCNAYCNDCSILGCPIHRTNQCQADSAICVQEGKSWEDLGLSTCNGKGCKISNCTADDTAWLDSAKAACQSIQGTNDFAIVDTNDVCEHRGHCCALDSLIDGGGCRWRCGSQDSLCSLKRGEFQYSVVPDTAVDGSDTTYTGLCYNNCFMHPSKDGRTGSVSGNVTVPDTTAAMASGTYYPDGFEGIRSEYGGLYVYDFLDVSTYEWMDSLLSAPCSSGMYRGIKNGKYVYWKMGDPVPDGVTSVVRIK